MTYRDAVILLVDDDPGDQELTRRALLHDVQPSCLHVVNNGEEALDYLLRRNAFQDPMTSPRPNLILLDLNMPKIDGKQVLEQISNHPHLRTIPVVVLTTSQEETDIARSYKLGCNSYITKPVDIEQFTEAVRQIGAYWFNLVALPKKVT